MAGARQSTQSSEQPLFSPPGLTVLRACPNPFGGRLFNSLYQPSALKARYLELAAPP
jgi:hypothetical protein